MAVKIAAQRAVHPQWMQVNASQLCKMPIYRARAGAQKIITGIGRFLQGKEMASKLAERRSGADFPSDFLRFPARVAIILV
ncbi:hypothetical protein [Hoeflea ulvae]|uniref:Uncharacterized protein n=1 Tax=Hoeflea ulvae TaxID=2983764 RepID=A0ABT3YGQ2_9HYPH|nr:hypothetical protein [Hoeflea ulvae]MCY0095080.1 hypothetical protein [Hoeflea ulvae]